MSEPSRNAVVIRTTETTDVSHVLRSPIAKLMVMDQAKSVLMPLLRGNALQREQQYETVIATVYRSAVEKPEILKCTPQSIVLAVADALETELQIGRTIHLVPLKNEKLSKARREQGGEDVYELDAWTGYLGDIELVIRSGAARGIDAELIYAKDHFDYRQGSNPNIDHRPFFPGDRGAVIGAYAVAHITQWLRKQSVLTMAQIEKVRAISKKWGPNKVKECPDWWAKKRAIKVVTHDLPRNPTLARVCARMEREDSEELDLSDMVEESPLVVTPSAAEPTAPRAAPAFEQASLDDLFPPFETGAPPAAATPRRTPAESYLMPFPVGAAKKSAELWQVSTGDLAEALRRARQDPKLSTFAEAAENVLEDRRTRESGQ